MAELSLGPILQAIPSLFDFLTQGKLAQLLERLIEQFGLFSQLRERVGYRAMYESLGEGVQDIKEVAEVGLAGVRHGRFPPAS